MLLAVGDPDVFYLVGVLEVPAAFGVARVEEVEFAAFVGPDLFEIADGEQLGGGAESGVAVAPERVEIIVFGENLQEFAGAAGDDVQGAAGKIAGFEDLIDVGGDERIRFGRNSDDGISGGEKRKDEREKAEERRLRRANDADGADGFIHGDGDVAERRVVDRAIEFVGPAGVREEALDGEANFFCGLGFADGSGETRGDFCRALREIFSDVVENLGAIVCCGFGPGFGFARGFDGVANVLAVAERGFTEELAFFAADGKAVAGVRASLLSADVKFHGAVDGGSGKFGLAVFCRGGGADGAGLAKPCGLEIFEQAFAAAFAAVTAFAIAAESASGVEEIGTVDPDDAGFDLRGDLESDVEAFAPNTGGKAVNRVVGELNGFLWSAEGHGGKHGAKNFLLSDDGSGVDVGEERGPVVEAA